MVDHTVPLFNGRITGSSFVHLFFHERKMGSSPRHPNRIWSLRTSNSIGTFDVSSSVGIRTDYGLDGPGSNLGVDEIFCTSRRALRPTQPPVQRVLCLSVGQRRLVREADPPPHLVPKVLENSRAIPLLTLRVCVAYKKGENLPTQEVSSGVNQEERDTDTSPISRAKVKNRLIFSYTSPPFFTSCPTKTSFSTIFLLMYSVLRRFVSISAPQLQSSLCLDPSPPPCYSFSVMSLFHFSK